LSYDGEVKTDWLGILIMEQELVPTDGRRTNIPHMEMQEIQMAQKGSNNKIF
jgi:hypothetical protein